MLTYIVVVVFACSLAVAQQPSVLMSDGVIHNSGTVKIYGDAKISQDTIKGVVEYLRNNADTQIVAHTTYEEVRFSGRSRKMILDPVRPVVSTRLFWSADTTVVFEVSPLTWIETNGTLRHEGLINPGRRDGTMKLRGDSLQDIAGRGTIPILELINDSGAVVTRGIGLRIVERLDLQQGQLNVTSQDNLAMQRDTWVWRQAGGSLNDELSIDQRINLRYYGDSLIRTGPEFMRSQTATAHLVQDARAGVVLTRDGWVNDSLIINAHLYTEESDSLRHTLFYTSQKDPVYGPRWPEINGTMERTNVVIGRSMRMNHEFASLKFPRAIDQGAVRNLRLRMKPKNTPLPLDDILFKVDRFMQFTALTAVGQVVPDSSYDLTMEWGWRARNDTTFEPPSVIETIPVLRGREDQLVLLRYFDGSYQPYGFSRTPTTRSNDQFSMWQYSSSQFIRASGDYAIGLSTGPIWVLNARVILEGAMRATGDSVAPTMSTDLAQLGLVPEVAPRIYPYSLDNVLVGDTAIAVGDSIVDWVTVEFRNDAFSNGAPVLIETVLLTKDGKLLDPQTLRPKIISGISAGFYHLAVRHRNHLSVITEDPVLVDRSNVRTTVDFTKGTGMVGGAASLRLISTYEGRRFFGLAAGNTDGGDSDIRVAEGIDRGDMDRIWVNRQLIDQYSIFDTNLDGVVSTLDWNYSWNNRLRDNSVVPR
ncbi:MAG: hypothetical protein IPP80_11340 [Ignavibacteria bacterium]|nr:hypothetical protein [Ignavibacteria bacterium]MBK6419088.1 hypothetical protein [Ignavibacteria bacterium]MBL0322946.1 hypothetical protein [Ignavibacteria bacterium]